MGRRKVGQEHIRSLQKSHGTYTVSLPIELVRELRWQEKQRLVITRSASGKLTLEDYKA